MKIIGIGMNYAEHNKELNAATPMQPVVFMKPDSALLRENKPFFLPDFSSEIHYEVEVVLKINRLGKNIAPQFASRYYDEFALGVDFTARDLQNDFRAKGLPWELAKGFDNSAVVSPFLPMKDYEKNNIATEQAMGPWYIGTGNDGLCLGVVSERDKSLKNFKAKGLHLLNKKDWLKPYSQIQENLNKQLEEAVKRIQEFDNLIL